MCTFIKKKQLSFSKCSYFIQKWKAKAKARSADTASDVPIDVELMMRWPLHEAVNNPMKLRVFIDAIDNAIKNAVDADEATKRKLEASKAVLIDCVDLKGMTALHKAGNCNEHNHNTK
jgi:hypothetical protein